jgi:hypothetical protein
MSFDRGCVSAGKIDLVRAIVAGASVLGMIGAVAVGVSAGVTHAGSSPRPADLDISQFQLTFDEPFDKLDVSAWGPGTRWIAHTPWNGDFGDARFVNPTPGFPFSVENGMLRIEAKRGNDGIWRSGLLASTDHYGHGFSQEYGYFEMRAKLPKGPGLWPAFWLVGNADNDTSVELDIMEYYGQFPDSYQSVVHLWKKSAHGRDYHSVMKHLVPADSLWQDFHTYGAQIDPDSIVFYLDRHEVGRAPTPPEFRRPVFILLDLAMGGGWPIDKTPDHSAMQVDYVRAYRKKDR